MREAEFRNWLDRRLWKGNPLTRKAKDNRVRRSKRAERGLQGLGFGQATLEAVFEEGLWDALITRLTDLKAGQNADPAAAKSVVPQADEPKGQLTNLIAALKQYGYFLEGRDPNYGAGDEPADAEDYLGLTRESVESVMQEYDQGSTEFMQKYGFAANFDYVVFRPGEQERYPAKAIFLIAYSSIPGNPDITAKGQRDTFRDAVGGPIHSEFRRLGYEIENRRLAKRQSQESTAMTMPTNLILYGPPGTGKTYHTAREAVALCDGLSEQDANALYPTTKEGRAELRRRYQALRDQERIGFVTFHQSYSYEDFVEGLRPSPIENEDGSPSGFELKPHDGIFKKFAKLSVANRAAAGSGGFVLGDRRVFKMSLGYTGNRENDYVFDEGIEHGYVRLGYDPIDYTDARFDQPAAIIEACQAYDVEKPGPDRTPPSNHSGRVQCPMIFRNWMKCGDLVVISKGNSHFRAIGEIVGDYEFDSEAQDYAHRRSVKWLRVIPEGEPVTEIYGKNFTMQSIYELYSNQLKVQALERYVNAATAPLDSKPLPHVIIIDEINRANISKVFGELITLIEPDKRIDTPEELTVELPYSGDRFGVPANLHIIGTMNTADRSIALLDTALRRRFNFREMAPEPGLLEEASKRTGIDLVAVLTTINRRIEYLIDREHRIGHAFFIGCETAEHVRAAMRDKVIPLLQEYFFEDWSRIAAVLGDGFISEDKLDPPPGIDGDRLSSWSVLWPFKEVAFQRLLGKAQASAVEPDSGE